MFGDKIEQKEQVSLGLSCGLCGEPVHQNENHTCDRNLNIGEENKELCQNQEPKE